MKGRMRNENFHETDETIFLIGFWKQNEFAQINKKNTQESRNLKLVYTHTHTRIQICT